MEMTHISLLCFVLRLTSGKRHPSWELSLTKRKSKIETSQKMTYRDDRAGNWIGCTIVGSKMAELNIYAKHTYLLSLLKTHVWSFSSPRYSIFCKYTEQSVLAVRIYIFFHFPHMLNCNDLMSYHMHLLQNFAFHFFLVFWLEHINHKFGV